MKRKACADMEEGLIWTVDDYKTPGRDPDRKHKLLSKLFLKWRKYG